MFKDYKFGPWKKEIKALLEKRLGLKDRIRYHKKKIKLHEDRIELIESDELISVENQLNEYLERAGN